MDMNRLQQIDAYRWTLPKARGEQRNDVLLYGDAQLLASVDNKVLEQIANVARLPGLVGAAMTMPDAQPANVSELAKKRQRGEMGTLGSGNHYLEVQVVDAIYDAAAARAFGHEPACGAQTLAWS